MMLMQMFPRYFGDCSRLFGKFCKIGFTISMYVAHKMFKSFVLAKNYTQIPGHIACSGGTRATRGGFDEQQICMPS